MLFCGSVDGYAETPETVDGFPHGRLTKRFVAEISRQQQAGASLLFDQAPRFARVVVFLEISDRDAFFGCGCSSVCRPG